MMLRFFTVVMITLGLMNNHFQQSFVIMWEKFLVLNMYDYIYFIIIYKTFFWCVLLKKVIC